LIDRERDSTILYLKKAKMSKDVDAKLQVYGFTNYDGWVAKSEE